MALASRGNATQSNVGTGRWAHGTAPHQRLRLARPGLAEVLGKENAQQEVVLQVLSLDERAGYVRAYE